MLEFLQLLEDDGCGVMEGNSGMVMEDVCEDCLQNLGVRLVLMLMRAGTLVGGVVVVAVGVISYSKERFLSVKKVKYLRVDFGW